MEILRAAIERGASDVHIKAGDVIRARVHGGLIPLTEQKLNPDQVRTLAAKLMPHEEDRQRIDQITDYDCSWGAPGLGRFRVNILRQRGSLMVVLRIIPIEIPTVEDLNLPPVLNSVAEARRGLILVTGVTGSGKSSTMAAMVDHINQTRDRHIVTLENPIEFLHRDNRSSITQRDVGTDTPSFQVGLRAALRQDPDVILIGEMRDSDTIDTALKAAETGHLVISTAHTRDAVSTVSRLVAMFDSSEQEMVRIRLADTIQSVVSQRLLPRQDQGGRLPACEVLIGTSTIRDCVRDPDRLDEVPELLEEGREHYGTQSFDQHLAELVESGQVSFEVAKMAARSPGDFELRMKTLSDDGSSAGSGITEGSGISPMDFGHHGDR